MFKHKIVVFVSGNGSNFENICRFFSNRDVFIEAIFSNNSKCKAISIAKSLGVRSFIFQKEELENGSVLKELQTINPDLIILAGFLLKIPTSLISNFPNKIINLHPSLLPKYGGKGMYGKHVHEAVLGNNEKESGITFHYVSEEYDEGDIIAQYKVELDKNETINTISDKIRVLEHQYFPVVIEKELKK